MDGEGWSCPGKGAGDRERWRMEDEACQRCRLQRMWRAGSFFPAGKRKREPEEERMAGDTKRKTGGTEVPPSLFFSFYVYMYI